MATDVKIPALGESISEATIGTWMKKVGDYVELDEPMAELETDKTALELPAPVAGVITAISAGEGDDVAVGAVVAQIDETAARTAAAAEAKAKPADEPAKAVPVAAPAASGGAAAAMPLAPSVRRMVEDFNLDPSSITGSGKDGRLTKADVSKALEAGTARQLSAHAGGAPAASAVQATPAAGRQEERVKMTRLRKTIAKRLKEAQNTAAMLTTFNDVDMTAVMETRARYKDLFAEKHAVKLGFMSFFTKACCLALRDVPAVNAAIEGEELVYRNYADIGIAVSAPQGLVVPVLRNADQLSFADTEKTIADFGRRARDGDLKADELQGGTFTITNGGIFGSLLSTPILNPPQAGILGMHRIEQRPMVMPDGSIQARPMMYLALSYDHRIIDGKEAVTFLVRVKEAIEDPARLLLDM